MASLFRPLKFHWGLIVVLAIYAVIAVTHSIVAPLTIGNDEWAHFLYTRFIAEQGHLPATVAERDEAGYKSDAPPLYHLLVAAATSGVEPVRLLRPLDSPRRYLADNIIDSYALVHTAAELLPYRGEVLVWHLGRGVAILLGLAVIGLTYLTGLELLPGRSRAWLAAALVAFIPTFIFHSSVLSYESFSAALAALFLLVAIRAIKRPRHWLWWPALGVLAGLSITTKYSAVLLPLEILFVAWLAFYRGKSRTGEHAPGLTPHASRITPHVSRLTPLLTAVILAGLTLLLAVSWWFGFIIRHFNTVDTQGPLVGLLQPVLVGDASDTTSVNVAAFLFGQETVEVQTRPPLERDYLSLFQTLITSFWTAPPAGPSTASFWLSFLFSLLALLGLAGLWRVWRQGDPVARTWLILLLFHTVLIIPLLLVRVVYSFDPREVAQGRHLLLPAASAIPILLVWGWQAWSPSIGPITAAGLLLWSMLGLLGRMVMTYPPPIPVWSEPVPETALAQARPVNEAFGEAVRLTGFAWRKQPDSASLEVTLWWKSQAIAPEDYLVELALLDRAGQIVSYDLGHPVQGRYPTRAWEPGDLIKDSHWLPLNGIEAGDYQLQLRLLTRTAQPPANDRKLLLDRVRLTGATANSPEACQVWRQGQPGRYNFLARPYRPRATVTVTGAEMPRLVPVDAAGRPEQKPLVSNGNIHIFVVGPDWAETYQVRSGSAVCATVMTDIPPRDFAIPDIPTPLEVDFNNEVRLLGYELPSRRINPGGRLPLTLYWQALVYMGEDYRIFDNLLDADQHRWGGYDRRARDGYSTLLWVPGEVITDAFGVPVDPAAPDGIYTLDIGLYQATGSEAVPLPVTVAGVPVEQNSVRLGPVKVGGPPPDVVTRKPSPQVRLNQSFGGQIILLGYDLTDDQGQPIQHATRNFILSEAEGTQHLKLTLYWQSETVPTADYTTFLHLRDQAGETVAQKDGPPAQGRYPTSLWDEGEIIVDEISLPLADVPPGVYTPVIGLYDVTSGARLPVAGNPAHELQLERVTLP